MDWIHVAENRNMRRVRLRKVMNLQVPLNSGNFFSTSVTFEF